MLQLSYNVMLQSSYMCSFMIDSPGLQVDLWTETIRTPEQVDYMLFPRFLAFAERAWHKAPWESMKDAVKRNKKHQSDWEKFAQKVGHKELRRLEEKGVMYRLDPPGAR